MTPEAKVKAKVKKLLLEYNAYFFMPATHGYGSSGVPDIVACFNGRFIGIECKAGSNKPTGLQLMNLNSIERTGGLSFVINEYNLGELENKLKEIK